VTAAGDQRFREKSKRVLLDRKKYADFLMVDHNLWGLKLHCDRAFILEDGKIEVFENLDEAVAIHTERLLAGPGRLLAGPGRSLAEPERSPAGMESAPGMTSDPAL
jgi:energy-coupling factor transporter ATP-binding protein EcfA2